MKKIIATYLLLLTLTGSASSTESLKRLFENQNYDEIIGILQTIPEQKLSAEELFYLGFSIIMIGNYKRGEKLLELSFHKKPLPETGKILAKIYFSRGNYRKVIEINKKLKQNVPDEVRLLTALSYKALGKDETAKSVAEKIKNPELKLKAGSSTRKITVFTTIKYDSNPLFTPEDEFRKSISGWIFDTGFKYSTISNSFYRGIKAFLSYQLNRNNKFLDYLSISPFFEKK